MSGAESAFDVVVAMTPATLDEEVARCGSADAIAVDVEANGLFAFRAKLCVVQLAWDEGGRQHVLIVDPSKVDVAPLGPLLGADGPLKVLHDLTFDARMLDEAGIILAHVRDTSVTARMLGLPAIGLAALLEAELGIKVEKRFQQHDWSRRPLTPEQIAYLSEDVVHLLRLEAHLAGRAEQKDITNEVADECAHKLATALRPPRDPRPEYVRVKGAMALDPPGRAVLRRLVEVRSAAAMAADVPPFKIVSNETLLDIARTRPATREALSGIRGATSGRAGQHASRFLHAVGEGAREGDVPEDERAHFAPSRPDREVAARRRALEGRVMAWRKAEALARGVDEQVVLPGHCAHDLVAIFLDAPPSGAALSDAIRRIAGIGSRRLERYEASFVALAVEPPSAGA